MLPKTKPLYGNCHGDHHGGNLCIDKNGQLTLFDFDCSGYGWRAYDVAVFLWSQHLSCGWSKTGKARATRRWHAFLRGYGNTRTLTQPELEATKVFVPIRHIWLLGLQAHGAEDWGRDWFNEEYLDREIEFIRQGITHYKI